MNQCTECTAFAYATEISSKKNGTETHLPAIIEVTVEVMLIK